MRARTWPVVFAGLCFCAGVVSCSSKTDSQDAAEGQDSRSPKVPPRASPLAPLVGVSNQLNKSFNAFLKGEDPVTAFAPWKLLAQGKERARRKYQELLAELKDTGAVSGELIGFEFELEFVKQQRTVYYLRTVVQVCDDRAVFTVFQGKDYPSGKGRAPDGARLSVCVGPARPFAEAAEALLKVFKANDWGKLPFAEDDVLADCLRLPEELRERMKKDLAEAREGLPAISKAISSLETDEVRLRLDDFGFLLRGSDGAFKGGLKCSWHILRDGTLVMDLKQLIWK